MNWMTERGASVAPRPSSLSSVFPVMTSPELVQKQVTVNLEQGLHMIPCSLIAKFAREVDCEIRVLRDDQASDARNVLELMMLSAEMGTPLILEGRGNGASEALDHLARMFEENFKSPTE
jgi:phosphocarrier protein HPr